MVANGEHEGHEYKMHMKLDDKSQQITQISQIIESVKSVKFVDKDIKQQKTKKNAKKIRAIREIRWQKQHIAQSIWFIRFVCDNDKKHSCSSCHPLATKKEIRC